MFFNLFLLIPNFFFLCSLKFWPTVLRFSSSSCFIQKGEWTWTGWNWDRHIDMGWCTAEEHTGIPTPILQPFYLQLPLLCGKQSEQIGLLWWWLECGESCSSHFPQRSLGEHNIYDKIFLTICHSVRSWTVLWGLDLLNFLGFLHLPSCWMVPSRYLLFQEFDPLVAWPLFDHLHVKRL